ncbi:MAG: succinylglutamate desuccinylase/aspartoacylase family protein [Armatimonadetes bacterium]|nr:succinylglutamate desuccinylase/aspartoacylase family protein [Armatimonadota bacterium]
MDVRIFGRNIAAGERAQFRVKVAEQNDGSDVTIPVIGVRGTRDGPVLALTGAIHGDEYAGWNVMRTLLPAIEPRRLRGTVVALPITNPFAFYGESRVNKLDYEFLNLNRIWPGDPNGFLSQVMAHRIFDGCLRHASYIIDYHEGGRDFLARYLMIGGAEAVRQKVYAQQERMARWFGQGIPIRDITLTEEMVRMGRWGTLGEAAGLLGIPTLVPELGGGGRIWDHFLQDGVRGTRNVMIGLEMIDGPMEGTDQPQHVARTGQWARPAHGGFVINRVELGDVVEEAGILGEVLDPYGQVVETLRAPFKSVILDTRFTTAVHPGDWTFSCGRIG